MSRIIITGSTGFVGRNLIPKLIKDQHHILELTRSIEKSRSLFGDMTLKLELSSSQEKLKNKIKDFSPEICIHLASYLSSSDEFLEAGKLFNSNIKFLINLLDCFKFCDLEYFINTGTFAEYSKNDSQLSPAYLYAATKSASRIFLDYYSEFYEFKYLTIIPYTIYGKKDSNKKILDIIYDSLDSDQPIDLSPGNQILDFIHINDIVYYYRNLIKNISLHDNKTVYKLGTGTGHTLKDLAKIFENLTNKKANIKWGALKYRKNDIMLAVSPNNKIFDKNPISLEEGVKLYINEK